MLCAIPGSSAGWAGAQRFAGRPLVAVLAELRGNGLILIYSSSAIPPDLIVTAESSAADPRDALVEILAPLGLEA